MLRCHVLVHGLLLFLLLFCRISDCFLLVNLSAPFYRPKIAFLFDLLECHYFIQLENFHGGTCEPLFLKHLFGMLGCNFYSGTRDSLLQFFVLSSPFAINIFKF